MRPQEHRFEIGDLVYFAQGVYEVIDRYTIADYRESAVYRLSGIKGVVYDHDLGNDDKPRLRRKRGNR